LNQTYTGSLKWPIVLVFARFFLAILLQFVVAVPYHFQGNPNPIEAAGHWFTVYGTLIDIGCLLLITKRIRRENLRLSDLVNVSQSSFFRTVKTSIGYVFLFLPLSIAGMSVSSFFLFGTAVPQQVMGGLPLWGAVYSVTVWPAVWAISEQITYQGYALPRVADHVRRKWIAVALVIWTSCNFST